VRRFPFFVPFDELYASVKQKNIIFTPGSEPACIRYAISSSQRIWKVCWHINHVTGFTLGVVSAVLGADASNTYFDSGGEEILPGEHARKSIDDLEYQYTDNWIQYSLKSIRVSGMPQLQGFQFVLEVESAYADGLPDAEELLKKLKSVKIFTAVIKI